MGSDFLVKLEDLEVSFGEPNSDNTAVKGVSLEIHKGKTVGIVGESGSGKSVTSLSMLKLLQSPGHVSGGRILWNAGDTGIQNIVDIPEDEMRNIRGGKISMIFQEPMSSLNPVLRCGPQVAEALRLHMKMTRKQARSRVIELFEQVKLPVPEEMYNRYPHELSGGQKQRVMIAMAISCKPRLLIADEPTTALDVTVQDEILNLLADLQREEGMAMIFITHDLGVVRQVASSTVVMYRGEVVEQGPTAQLFESPQHPYTKGLLACRPVLDSRPVRLPTVRDFLEDGQVEENRKKDLSSEVSPAQREENLEMLMSSEPLLRVVDLNTWFAQQKGFFTRNTTYFRAVDGVTFDVYKGETLGLVGESGCGKTTLGRSILRLIEPTGGSVYFGENDMLSLSGNELRKERKKMQIVFQDPFSSLNPRLTVGSALTEPMKVHKLYRTGNERIDRAVYLLEKVGLSADHINRYPHEFSGGQRQRICIARALSVEPQFLICDESVSALDVSVQAQVLNLLNDLKDEFGLTYIFISHDLAVVKYMSDRMMVMNKGKIEEIGEADSIYRNPQSDYTKRLIDSIPV